MDYNLDVICGLGYESCGVFRDGDLLNYWGEGIKLVV